MNAKELKKYISENDKIPEILESLGMHSINGSNPRYYSCGVYNGDNPTSTIVYRDELLTVNAYTRNISDNTNIKPNIFNLIMFVNNCDFSSAIFWCHKVLGLSNNYSYKSKNIKDPLSKLRKYTSNQYEYSKDDIIYYDLSILDKYSKEQHIDLIRNDGIISQRVLDKYMIMFDDRSDRIIFPHLKYDDVNKIAGVVGRTVHKAYKELKINKYMSMLDTKFDKTLNIYGLSLNIDEIKKRGIVCVFEAEKSVIKLDMYGDPIGVALGCHDISNFQRILLMKLEVEICICFDKDVCDEHIQKVCESLSLGGGRKVTYIKDDNNLLGEKDSPVDKGYRVWRNLFENRKRHKI